MSANGQANLHTMRSSHLPVRRAGAAALLLFIGLPTGCADRTTPQPVATVEAPAARETAATTPADAVLIPTRLLRQDRLDGFVQVAVPPDLHRQLQAAWQQGRTCWPLEELPFGQRIPGLLQTLSAAGAEQRLRRGFDQQFAGADAELHAAARALTLFGTEYLQREGDFSAQQRQHYPQLVQAVGGWAAATALGDPDRGRAAIQQMTIAARRSGLHTPAHFRQHGLDDSLQRLGGFSRTLKQQLLGYGLDVDVALSGMQTQVQAQQADRATLRIRYRLHRQAIEAEVDVERIDGHWYVSDFLRGTRQALAAPPSSAPGAGCSA